ncbi:NADPH-dependent FMN reductase [Smaragdicoccus niigatensis]|uniref:NADPH-dependent FMN reductase n=1 Tax=Smaragdicoccus niigatensis TaxID=359359 RepID=UPI00058F888A|nr:NAD(P)H-dependent oxidoreductase [Smaragdicoccus niigatensis]
MSTTVIVGNPKPRSRTYSTAVELAERITSQQPDHVIDLADYGPRLFDWTDQDVRDLVSTVASSSLIIVASPTYKATYTGLLKLFLDRFSAGQLSRTVAVPLLVGGDWRHSLAPEVHLKPVLAELGASTPTRGLFLLDCELLDSEAFSAWFEIAIAQLRSVVPA